MADIHARRRRRWIGVAALLTVVTLADTVVWAWACRRLSDDAEAQFAAAGWSLDAAPARWAGWPVGAEIVLDHAALRTGLDIVPPLAWTVPSLTLRIAAWSPTRLAVSAAGGQTLAIGAASPIPFKARSLSATIDLTGHDAPRIAATALDVAAPGGPVEVASATLDLMPETWSADLAGLTVPGPARTPLTPAIDRLRLHGRVQPTIPALPTARASAEAWRARNGHVAIELDELRWGAVFATGDADLTLDAALQPAITGQIEAAGLSAGVTQLAATGALTPSAATAAQAMLAILSAPSGTGPVPLPFALRDGVLTIARIPLLRVLPLDWGPL